MKKFIVGFLLACTVIYLAKTWAAYTLMRKVVNCGPELNVSGKMKKTDSEEDVRKIIIEMVDCVESRKNLLEGIFFDRDSLIRAITVEGS